MFTRSVKTSAELRAFEENLGVLNGPLRSNQTRFLLGYGCFRSKGILAPPATAPTPFRTTSFNFSLEESYEFWSQFQNRISVVRSPDSTGKRGRHIPRGLAFFRSLPRGHGSLEGWSVTQGVPILLQGLRPVSRSARPGSSAGLQRHARVTTHGFP